MADKQEIFQSYMQLRTNGTDSRAALQRLKENIASLTQAEREQLGSEIRAWEAQKTATPAPVPASRTAAPVVQPLTSLATAVPPSVPADAPVRGIKPLASQPTALPTLETLTTSIDVPAQPLPSEPITGESTSCPACGHTNTKTSIICQNCGRFLQATASQYDTEAFETDEPENSTYFGPESLLVLLIKKTQTNFKIPPTNLKREYVVGRTAGQTLNPDLDLTEHKAADMGVSRMHLSLRFDEKHNTVIVTDLGSANGTFINGQRMHPQEVRVLHHGDELRLGRMPLQVYILHAQQREASKAKI